MKSTALSYLSAALTSAWPSFYLRFLVEPSRNFSLCKYFQAVWGSVASINDAFQSVPALWEEHCLSSFQWNSFNDFQSHHNLRAWTATLFSSKILDFSFVLFCPSSLDTAPFSHIEAYHHETFQEVFWPTTPSPYSIWYFYLWVFSSPQTLFSFLQFAFPSLLSQLCFLPLHVSSSVSFPFLSRHPFSFQIYLSWRFAYGQIFWLRRPYPCWFFSIAIIQCLNLYISASFIERLHAVEPSGCSFSLLFFQSLPPTIWPYRLHRKINFLLEAPRLLSR